MHQTSTGTKKQKIQQLLRSGPIVPGNFSFVFFGACAGLVHLVVWFFCFFGACAGLVTLTSQNIDRHQKKQKKQTTRCTKHRHASKKQKKTKNPATTQKWTHSSWKFYFWVVCCFFCFFGACRCLVHLVVCFFWCMSMFCEVRATKPAQAPKKKTNKPLDAPNLHRRQKKLKFPGLWVHFWVVAGMFCFLSFFGACRCLVHLVVWLFLFFLVPVNVLWSQSHQTCTGTKKKNNKTNH